jgi:ATP adenylyltransferase
MSGPDEWERLWTPHRMAYIRGENKPSHTGPGDECAFCVAPSTDDESSLVLARGEHVYAVLNLYPYNPGHLMVCPYRHVADYTDLTDDEVHELAAYTRPAMRTVREVSAAQGFNIGMNQGSMAGAGIAGHLHQHVVPRWGGDSNFMSVIGGTRTMAELLEDTRDLLAAAWR